MKNIALSALFGILPAAYALEPQPPMQPAPTLIPQPALVVQQTGQLAITDRSPQPAVIIQKQGQLWTTSTGEVLMPLNIRQEEGK
jgi:hypothetical protein